MKIHPLVASICLSGFTLVFARADVNTPAEYVITNEVARPAEKVPPIGANDFGGTGGSDFSANNLFSASGNEQPVWKNIHRAVNVEGKSFELDGGGSTGKSTSWYELWNDGFLSGARVRLYRIVDKSGNPLPVKSTGPKTTNLDMTNADRVVFLGETHVIKPGEEGFKNGGWVVSDPPEGRKPYRAYLAADSPELAPYDYVVIEKPMANFDMAWVHPRVRGLMGAADHISWYWNSALPDTHFSLVPHPGKLPADMVDPGKSCLQVDAAPGENMISQIRFISPDIKKENLYYGQFEPGRQYRMEVWLRQEGLGDGGKVTFGLNIKVPGHENIEKTFDVTGQWTKYTFDFVGPERPTKVMHYGPAFKFTGPGQLWMDNARLFRYDTPADLAAGYAPNKLILDTLVATQPATGEKGSHRVWVLDRDATMDSLMSWHPSTEINIGPNTSIGATNRGRTLPVVLGFDLATGNSAATRMVPHIVIQHMVHDEKDWQNLIEYLGAPYDPATDSPETKPFAYRRFQQRGVGTPWTDEFRELIIEFGNETWHNSKTKDWIGFSLYGLIHQGGAEYGLFARYLIDNIKKSPYWASQNLASRVHFCLGGNYGGRVEGDGARGYAEEAIQKCPEAQYIGHANYFGPKWETGQKQLATFNDEGLLGMILNFQVEIKPRQAAMNEARIKLGEKGIKYDIIAYEGGPSGYAIDREARGNEALVEAAENYGKSLGAAVCSIDTWLGSALQGWTYQNYFTYAQGRFWSSHTMFFEGFRAHVPWLAMELRNHFASGDLMKVTEKQVPTMPSMEKGKGKELPVDLPLTGVYAMHDGAKNTWSVIVLSRKLNANVFGQDMGDGFSKISLQLPFKSAQKVSLHRLTGDPRANNRSAENVKIESLTLDPTKLTEGGGWAVDSSTGGGTGGMPPGSVFVYVFEGVN